MAHTNNNATPSDENFRGRGYTHLHLHSEYSLLDGANRIDKLIAHVKALGMNAVAVTDHGNLHGAVKFYNTAKAAGIKPILGIEAYVAPKDRLDRTHTGIADGGFHLVLLAENNTGWRNLLKLSSDAYLRGFYYKPRMDKSTLEKWSAGLIAINGHLGSSIAHHLTEFHKTHDQSHWNAALEEALWHKKTFPPTSTSGGAGEPCFYIELQHHVDEQNRINPLLVKLARQLDLPLVCDNDSHFLLEEDYDAHDSLVCISTGKTKNDPARMKYPPQVFVKSPKQMADIFSGYLDTAGDEALDNTTRIADRCNVDLDFKSNHAPVVKVELKTPSDESSLSCRLRLSDAANTNIADFVRNFKATDGILPGATEWFNQFCAQIELLPFDSSRDTENAADLKKQCDAALRLLAEAGAVWRYGSADLPPNFRARLDRELQVLADKSISAYFLIVWDFVNFARSHGIPANARGSGVGTMVGYCLGLSNACPVHYGLLFERFTDPDRSEYPDIDIDICQDGRARVIEYVRKKYGHVAQIVTFGTLKARAAIRDVGRVLDIPLSEVDRIAKLIPEELGITLEQALAKEADLRKEYDGNPIIRQLLDTAGKLEGMARHSSVHAAGVVIATQPLDNIVPLCKQANSDDAITQWDGPTCEKVGLLKMDFLGLRTLSIVQRAKDLINATLSREIQLQTITGQLGAGPVPDSPREFNLKPRQSAHGSENAPSKPRQSESSSAALDSSIDPLDLDRLTYLDQNVLDLFRRGDTKGVFQFESGGMRDLLMAMKPDRLEDLIAANALYRPGPMDLIPDYNDRKHGRKETPRVHKIVDDFTRETHGIMVYQEQVMQIVHALGGIPLRAAYSLIKAISKKKHKDIDAVRPKFIQGAGEQGLDKDAAEELFEMILKFAGYGFNKSHSTGYAIIAYQTAYLKTYFPVHYMAALLTYESVSTDKVVEYIDECRRVRTPNGRIGIEVLPPDINSSFTDFTVVYDKDEPHNPNHGHVRFGLGAVKGVGNKAVDAIITARTSGGPFKSLFDFCERVSSGAVNKGCLEALIKCGAFDALHGTDHRSAMIAGVELAVARGAQEAELRNADDFLFGAVESSSTANRKPQTANDEPHLPAVDPWDRNTQLAEEKSVLGFYVSAHPMDQHRDTLQRFSNVNVRDFRQLRAEQEVTLGGMLTRIRPTFVKTGKSAGQKMAMLTLEDRTGTLDGVIFSDGYAKYAHLLTNDAIVFVKGKVDRRREEPGIRIDQVIPVNEAAEQLTQAVRIILRDRDVQGQSRQYNGELQSLRNMLRQLPGAAQLFIEIHESQKVVILQTRMGVKATTDLPDRIDTILQQQHSCELLGPMKLQITKAVMATDAERVVNRLKRDTADEEFCESIDRY
ncbi:MAG: DNA polymerase III subunit alpha [Phycisphaerales bacterium]